MPSELQLVCSEGINFILSKKSKVPDFLNGFSYGYSLSEECSSVDGFRMEIFGRILGIAYF